MYYTVLNNVLYCNIMLNMYSTCTQYCEYTVPVLLTQFHGLPIGCELETPQLNDEIIWESSEAGTLHDHATAALEIVNSLFDEEGFKTGAQIHSRDHLLLRVAASKINLLIYSYSPVQRMKYA